MMAYNIAMTCTYILSFQREKHIMNQQNSTRSIIGGISGGIFLIGLAIAFYSGYFLPVLFITIAITSLLGSLGSLRPNAFYGGIHSFVWLMGLAFCFAFGFWPWILVVCGVSAILGALRVPIMNAILGMGIFSLASLSNQQPQQTDQPYQQGYQGYEQPAQSQESYQEGGQQHQYPPQTPQEYQPPPTPQYEQPQAQYEQPQSEQEMPPQQMQ
jgi:hypothetical protein